MPHIPEAPTCCQRPSGASGDWQRKETPPHTGGGGDGQQRGPHSTRGHLSVKGPKLAGSGVPQGSDGSKHTRSVGLAGYHSILKSKNTQAKPGRVTPSVPALCRDAQQSDWASLHPWIKTKQGPGSPGSRGKSLLSGPWGSAHPHLVVEHGRGQPLLPGGVGTEELGVSPHPPTNALVPGSGERRWRSVLSGPTHCWPAIPTGLQPAGAQAQGEGRWGGGTCPSFRGGRGWKDWGP